MPRRVSDPVASFWSKVTKSDGCWEFPVKGRNTYGYGRHWVPGRGAVTASRYSWEIHFGPIPDGVFVCHKCDNPPCVRPDHLFLGTHLDNVRDCISKGRAADAREMSKYRKPKTHCSRGHEFTPANTYTIPAKPPRWPNPSKLCRACVRERQRLYRIAKRERKKMGADDVTMYMDTRVVQYPPKG